MSLCHRRPHVATDIAGRWHRNRSRVADGGQSDRWLKFSHYRRLPSPDEYLLVDLNSRATDCYRKGAAGLWVLHPFARGEVVDLASCALTMTAAQLFAPARRASIMQILSPSLLPAAAAVLAVNPFEPIPARLLDGRRDELFADVRF